MDILKEKVLKKIRKNRMVETDDKIILAVSGGPDSIAMLYLMNDLRYELRCSLHIAHLNHCLRGEESDVDAEFVKEQALKLNIPITVENLYVKSMITNKESIESGARRIRYDFYKKVMSDVKADKVAQGHTADDQAETILMRLLRGSGTKGLSGIPPVRDDIYIRPLIEISRSEIEAYLQSIGVEPRRDSSNLSTEYDRNRIRHELIPLLEEKFSPNIKSILQTTGDILRTEDDFLATLTKASFGKSVTFFNTPPNPSQEGNLLIPPLEKNPPKIIIQINDFKEQHLAIQRRILRLAIESLLGDLNRYDFQHIDEIMSLIDNGMTGSSISLPRGIIAEKSYGEIIIKLGKSESIEPFDYIIKIPGEIHISQLGLKVTTSFGEFGNYSKELYQKTFDYDIIKGDLHLRNRQQGDKFQPLGMSGTKKLKEYFIDKKIPRSQRNKIKILTDGNNIMWIVGYNTIDDRYKVTTQTKTHLNVTVSFLQPPD
jgi:tRNA(Ile)-lysidine synthase